MKLISLLMMISMCSITILLLWTIYYGRILEKRRSKILEDYYQNITIYHMENMCPICGGSLESDSLLEGEWMCDTCNYVYYD